MKFWNKWLRKIHRWFAIPTLILIPLSVILKVSGNGQIMARIPQWEITQSLLMLLLAITGGYLYLIPYLSKWKRNKKRRQATTQNKGTSS
jgi:hypothetical protein